MYQVLYRKWRPRRFADVVGQPHVTKTLLNELRGGHIAHAYLFTGSRGTGKTTCAKILSKAVNCLSPVDGDPCGECENCRGIDDGSILDVIEIDAASNNGVDNIRDLREEANYTPAKAKFRVYIIDEVHMLSTGAFNALLKTLEEPPEHVIFILATTEVHKLPATILSRCQRFDFHRIPPEEIAARLQYVAGQEQIDLTDGAALMLARLADGAMRDALSLLDRCAGRGEQITEQLVSETTGMAGRDYLYTLSDAAAKGDSGAAVAALDDLHNGSCDMSTLATELLGHYRNMMIIKTAKEPEKLIVCTQAELNELRAQADRFTLEQVLCNLDLLQRSLENIRRGADRRTELEMALIRMCTPSLNAGIASLEARISELERKIAIGIPAQAAQPAANPTPAAQSAVEAPVKPQPDTPEEEVPPPPEAPNPPAPAPTQSAPAQDIPFDRWNEVIESLMKTNPALVPLLSGSTANLRGMRVLIRSANPVLAKLIKQNGYAASLNEAIRTVTGQNYKAAVYNTPAPAQNPAADPLTGLIGKLDEAGVSYTVE